MFGFPSPGSMGVGMSAMQNLPLAQKLMMGGQIIGGQANPLDMVGAISRLGQNADGAGTASSKTGAVPMQLLGMDPSKNAMSGLGLISGAANNPMSGLGLLSKLFGMGGQQQPAPGATPEPEVSGPTPRVPAAPGPTPPSPVATDSPMSSMSPSLDAILRRVGGFGFGRG
jgi:hypothetical protein